MKTAVLWFASLFAASVTASAATAADWVIDSGASSISFETAAFGTEVTGDFLSFGGNIHLDTDDLASANIDAFVELASVDTGTAEVDNALRGPEGFAPEEFARATFSSEDVREAETCESEGARCLVASGTLTIRGVSQPLELSFTLSREGGHASADATFDVRRQEFGIGTSEWEDAGRIATVHLHIEADRAD